MDRSGAICEAERTLEGVRQMSDAEVMTGVGVEARQHRAATARLLAHMSEVDARGLYRAEACSSMFAYCVERLHMSEPATYRRIRAARAARRFPRLLTMVTLGELHLSAIKLLAPHLTEDNCEELLAEARHARVCDVERILARRFPGAPAVSSVRRRPRTEVRPIIAEPGVGQECKEEDSPVVASAATSVASVSQRGLFAHAMDAGNSTDQEAVSTGSREHYAVSFTASGELRNKLRQVQDLMRHQNPSGDLAPVIDRAVTLLLGDLLQKRFGRRRRRSSAGRKQNAAKRQSEAGGAPTPNAEMVTDDTKAEAKEAERSRHIPNAVRREVVDRDGLRCTFVDARGRRCSATGFLQLHHKHAFGKGGEHSVENVAVLCATHNRLLAELEFGVHATGPLETTGARDDGS